MDPPPPPPRPPNVTCLTRTQYEGSESSHATSGLRREKEPPPSPFPPACCIQCLLSSLATACETRPHACNSGRFQGNCTTDSHETGHIFLFLVSVHKVPF